MTLLVAKDKANAHHETVVLLKVNNVVWQDHINTESKLLQPQDIEVTPSKGRTVCERRAGTRVMVSKA